MLTSIYTDGGVILNNPSVHGGTWAFVFVDENDQEIFRKCGLVTPNMYGMKTIGNNLTELLAAIEAIEYARDAVIGVSAGLTLYTDSNVTRLRFNGSKMNGVPYLVVKRFDKLRSPLPFSMRIVLLDGHPTKKHLALGQGKRGNMCSRWNVECDKMCGELARQFMMEMV